MEPKVVEELVKAGPFGVAALLMTGLAILWRAYREEQVAAREYQRQVTQLCTALEKLVQSHEVLADTVERVRMETASSVSATRQEIQVALAGIQAHLGSHGKRTN